MSILSKNNLCLSLFVLSALSSVQSQASDLSWSEWQDVHAKGSAFLQITIDNDSLLLTDKDRFYTSGNHLSQTFFLKTSNQEVSYTWQVGQDLYTASDIKLTPAQIPKNDHPYAGWLFGGIYREVANTEGQGSKLGLELGCLGFCAGGARTQNNLHRIIKQPLPQAWSTQVSNEPGFVLSGEWTPLRWTASSIVDISPRIKARFGNIFTDVGADMTLRVGALNALPQQPAHYAFLRGEAKEVAYNATLQGGYFNHQRDEQNTGITPKRSVGELELGYFWRTPAYGISASVLRRSNEIKELSNSIGAQSFARLQFFYAM